MNTDVWKAKIRCPESSDGRRIQENTQRLRQVETSRSLHHCYSQLLLHSLLARIIRKLQVVDTSHDTWKVVISCQRRFVRFSDNSKWRVQTAETYEAVGQNMPKFDQVVTYHQSATLDYR
jgi:hypothetical protein